MLPTYRYRSIPPPPANDAPEHMLTTARAKTLGAMLRLGSRCSMARVCAVLLAAGVWLPADGQSGSSPATVAAAPEKNACEAGGGTNIALTRTQRAQVQQGLNALKFDVGTADGIFGPRTRAGIARWQVSRAEAATGCLDEEDVAILIEVSKAGAPTQAAAAPVSSGQPEGLVTAAPKTPECAEATGQIVTLQAPEKVWKNLEGQQTTKSEFETSAQFAARTRETTRRASRRLAVEGTYDPGQVMYNADAQEFTVAVYAWDNLADGVDRVEGRLNRQVLPSRWDDMASIGLKEREYEDGEYVGQNAFGATARVTKIQRERYSVYDQVLPSKKEWRTETTRTDSSHGVSIQVPAVRLRANVDNARALKKNMRVGVIIRPKAPFVATTEKHWSARIDNPREVREITHIIIADLLCAVLTDETGQVLKMVDRHPE